MSSQIVDNIAAILSRQAACDGDRPAIIDDRSGESLTFAELERRVQQTATLLHRSGLNNGDAVLVFQPMSATLYVVLLALWRLGLVAVFLDPSAGRDYIDRCCELYPPKAFIASSKAHLLRLRSSALRRIPVQVAIGLPVPGAISIGRSRWLSEAETSAIVPCTADTPALMTFTSGSTGQPKAALRSHGFLLAQHQVLERSLSLTSGEVDLTTLPIFLLANLASGVTSLIPNCDLRLPGRVKSDRLMRQIQRYHPTSTAASPALLTALVDYCDRHAVGLTSFQRIFTGGAPVFPNLLERLQRLAPQADIYTVYGSTEAEPIAHITYREMQPDDRAKLATGGGLLVGEPVPETAVNILPDRWGTAIAPMSNEEFQATSLPIEAIGEIVVSGNHVLSGYWQGMGDRDTKFRVGETIWHRTGDAGYRDVQNRLWLVGRCSARIEDEFGIIYPFMVEAIASLTPTIRRTALVQWQGKRLLAIELEPRAEQSNLEALKKSLEWANIQEFRIYKRIPVDRRHNAKVNYPMLFKLLEQ